MPDIKETLLPGVGVRHEFTTAGGERLSLLTHRSGRRELAVYDRDDPDRCRTVLHLSGEDTTALGDLLGVNQVSETVRGAQQLQGLAIDWLTLPTTSRFAGATIADGEFRTKTGASIVAIVRDETTIPAPEPTTSFRADDVIVAVGTPQGLELLRTLLGS
ncbi:MAG TPA: cation:proton antiporter regulatory subunit [Acidimicrobiales bacterium]|nr:cation:proton antiporter regulatory subunit [Acidimicrobiales bacterium]